MVVGVRGICRYPIVSAQYANRTRMQKTSALKRSACHRFFVKLYTLAALAAYDLPDRKRHGDLD